MNAVGKIGVIIPEIFDPLDFELLSGIDEIARAYGFDVIIFTGIRNSITGMEKSSYERGLENIYSLVGITELDGIFSLADVVMMQKWILAVPDANLIDWKAGDLCEDDRLDVFDLCLMKRLLINQK